MFSFSSKMISSSFSTTSIRTRTASSMLRNLSSCCKKWVTNTSSNPMSLIIWIPCSWIPRLWHSTMFSSMRRTLWIQMRKRKTSNFFFVQYGWSACVHFRWVVLLFVEFCCAIKDTKWTELRENLVILSNIAMMENEMLISEGFECDRWQWDTVDVWMGDH